MENRSKAVTGWYGKKPMALVDHARLREAIDQQYVP
jgi:hypothetical protein